MENKLDNRFIFTLFYNECHHHHYEPLFVCCLSFAWLYLTNKPLVADKWWFHYKLQTKNTRKWCDESYREIQTLLHYKCKYGMCAFSWVHRHNITCKVQVKGTNNHVITSLSHPAKLPQVMIPHHNDYSLFMIMWLLYWSLQAFGKMVELSHSSLIFIHLIFHKLWESV